MPHFLLVASLVIVGDIPSPAPAADETLQAQIEALKSPVVQLWSGNGRLGTFDEPKMTTGVVLDLAGRTWLAAP